MDLIYATPAFEDVGVLQNFTLDMAYGLDENNFEIVTELTRPFTYNEETKENDFGWYVYIEGTEYGGIVDEVQVNTEADELKYMGRTWNGVLASKIIEPDAGEDYLIVSGYADEILADLITRCGLDDVFTVDVHSDWEEEYRITVDEFRFRYADLNSGVFDMLQDYDGKLIISCHHSAVHLEVTRRMNYATQEELESSQIDFEIAQTHARCNHLVCLGQGVGKNRAVIHLFTDDGGGLQPYATTETPIKDSDYILDKSSQVLTGIDEDAEVYDYPDAAITKNYELLTTEPDDWPEEYYIHYYEMDSDDEEEGEGTYNLIEQNIQDEYVCPGLQPGDWAENYWNYYTRTYDSEAGEYDYEQVEQVTVETYHELTKKPKSWDKKYSSYYYQDNQGNFQRIAKVPVYKRIYSRPSDWKKKYGNYYTRSGQGVYSAVSGESKTKYIVQTVKPSVWATNWKNYWIKQESQGQTVGRVKAGTKTKYIQVKDDPTLSRRNKAPKWEKGKYYDQSSYTIAPKFSSTTMYYMKMMGVPSFSSFDEVYEKRKAIQVIPWQSNTYYRLYPDEDVGVEFKPDCFYKQVLDRYAELVEGGIERLAELNEAQEMSVSVKGLDQGVSVDVSVKELDIEYNIGDTVGGTEVVSGLEIAQPITKKIVKIENDVVDITYESKKEESYGG